MSIEYLESKEELLELHTEIIRAELTPKLHKDITYKRDEDKYLQQTGTLKIDKKTVMDKNKSNNQLKFNFRSSIVDNQTNYFVGKPIRYNLDNLETDDKHKYPDETVGVFSNHISLNMYPQKDKETARLAAIMGASGRLFYVQDETVRFINLKRYEYLIIKNAQVDKIDLALRYYYTSYDKDKYLTVEVYDNTFIYFYREVAPGSFRFEEHRESMPHLFSQIPLVEFLNDDYGRGDFQVVDTLIDAYDNLASLQVDEVEDLRNAYLVIKGGVLDNNTIRRMRETGVINFDTLEGDAYYVTRSSTLLVKDILENLEDKIYKLSATIDFNAKDFVGGGAESGESRRYKLIGMEGKSMDKENNFRAALTKQFQIVCSGYENLKVAVMEPIDVYYEFSRNLPVDLLYYAQVLTGLAGQVSDKTRLDLMPFIPNTDEELARIEEERDAYRTPGLFAIDDDEDEG